MVRVLVLVCGVVGATVGSWWHSEWIVECSTVALLGERAWAWQHAAPRWHYRAYIIAMQQVLACALLVAFCCALAVYGNGQPAIIDQMVPRVQMDPAAWLALVYTTPEARVLLAFFFTFWCLLSDLVIVLVEQPHGQHVPSAAMGHNLHDGDLARQA